jgi:hypothetical protein
VIHGDILVATVMRSVNTISTTYATGAQITRTFQAQLRIFLLFANDYADRLYALNLQRSLKCERFASKKSHFREFPLSTSYPQNVLSFFFAVSTSTVEHYSKNQPL